MKYMSEFLTHVPTCCTYLPLYREPSYVEEVTQSTTTNVETIVFKKYPPLFLTASEHQLNVVEFVVETKTVPSQSTSSSTTMKMREVVKFDISESLTNFYVLKQSSSSNNNTNSIVLASGVNGSLFAFEITMSQQQNVPSIRLLQTWPSLHLGVITSFDVCQPFDDELMIVTVGEDGKINMLHLKKKSGGDSFQTSVLAEVIGADLLPLIAVRFQLRSNDFAVSLSQIFFTLSATGEIKKWDLKKNKTVPELTLRDDAAKLYDSIHYTCLDVHPSRADILIVGDSQGVLSVWDIRQTSSPLYRLQPAERFPVSGFGIRNIGPIWKLEFLVDQQINVLNVFAALHNGQLVVWRFNESDFNYGIADKQYQFAQIERRVELEDRHASVLSFAIQDSHLAVVCDTGRLFYGSAFSE